MKQLLIVCAFAFAPLPALADDPKPPFNFGDMAPLADSLRDLMEGLTQDILPLMEQLGDMMPDLNAYEAPEILPNGDILIRRKPKQPPAPDAPPEANSDGSIDL